jgi:hypothetical protein
LLSGRHNLVIAGAVICRAEGMEVAMTQSTYPTSRRAAVLSDLATQAIYLFARSRRPRFDATKCW